LFARAAIGGLDCDIFTSLGFPIFLEKIVVGFVEFSSRVVRDIEKLGIGMGRGGDAAKTGNDGRGERKRQDL